MLHMHRRPCSCYELYLVFFIFSAFLPCHHFYPALKSPSLPSWRGCEKNEFRAARMKGNWYRKYRTGVQRTWALNPICSLVFFRFWCGVFSLGVSFLTGLNQMSPNVCNCKNKIFTILLLYKIPLFSEVYDKLRNRVQCLKKTLAMNAAWHTSKWPHISVSKGEKPLTDFWMTTLLIASSATVKFFSFCKYQDIQIFLIRIFFYKWIL